MGLPAFFDNYRDLLAKAGLYGIANAVNAGVPFLLLPVVVRFLSPAEYGYYSIFVVIFQLLIAVVGFTTHSAIARAYLDQGNVHLPAYIFNCMLILVGSTALWALLLISLPQLFGAGNSPLETRWLLAALVSASGQYMILVRLSLWQMQGKPICYAIFQFGSMLMLIGLTLFNVVFLRMGWAGCVRAHLTTYLTFGVLAFVLLLREGMVRIRVNIHYIRHALSYGAPLVPHSLGSWAINMADRVILMRLLGPAETGIYSFGYQFGMVLSLVQNSFNQAFVPWLFAKLSRAAPGMKGEVVRLTYAYILGIILLAATVGVMGPRLVRMMGTPAYASAGSIVIWIALAYAFNGMYKLVANYIFYAQKTYILAITTFLAASLNIFFTFRWVKLHGAIGAAYATTLAYSVSFLLVWIASQRVFPMPWFSFNRGESS